MSARPERRRPVKAGAIYGPLLFGVPLVVWGWLWLGMEWSPLVAWLVPLNAVTLLAYGLDKGLATRGWLRVPEAVLHVLTLVGGSLAAFLGMQLFRHKTRKGSFQLVFWILVVLQAGALGAWFILSREG